MTSIAAETTSSMPPSGDAVPAHRSGVDRVVALDIARGIAVLGMLGAHAVGALSPVSDAVLVGRPSMLFFFLAGVTVGLTAVRRRLDDDATAARRRSRLMFRACTVFALGIALLGVGFQSVLPVHGVLLALLVVVLRVRSQALLVAATVLALVVPQIQVLSDGGTFGGALDDFPVIGRGALAVVLPAAGYAACSLAGLVIGRRMLTGRLRVGALAGIGAALTVVGFGVGAVLRTVLGPSEFLSAQGHSGTTVELVGSIGASMLVLAACLALPGGALRALRPVAAVGTLALTMYLLHFVLVIVALSFCVGPIAQWIAFAAIAAVMMALSVLILRRYRRGPLEWVVATAANRLSVG
jgi:hypothetical protein